MLVVAAVALQSAHELAPAPRAQAPTSRSIVEFLAADELEGRGVGTPGEARAAAFVEQHLRRAGFVPVGGTGRQPVRLRLDGGVIESAGNVVFALDAGANRTVLLGAHYDHLGLGGPLSREILTQAVHNGADDNASGVALLLRLAFRQSALPAKDRTNLVVVAFGAEEEGLHGSAALLDAGWIDPNTLVAALNFDMVGRLDALAPVLALEGVQEFPAWRQVLSAVPPPSFTVRTEGHIVPGGSDHCTFATAGVPVLSFSTGQTDDYHRPSDDVERLNWQGLGAIERYAGAVLDALVLVPVDLRQRPADAGVSAAN